MSSQILKFEYCPVCGWNSWSVVNEGDFEARLIQGDWAFVECDGCGSTYAHTPVFPGQVTP